MKKILLISLMILAVCLVGCQEKNTDNVELPSESEVAENTSVDSTDENSNKTVKLSVDEIIGNYNGQQQSLTITKNQEENMIDLEYTVWQKLYPRIAIINVKGILIDENNEGTFSFEDDGWYHKGNGKIIFEEGKATLELSDVVSTEQVDNSMWTIGQGTYIMYKINKINAENGIVYSQFNSGDVNIPFINLDFENVKQINDTFAEMISIAHSNSDPTIEHYEYDYNLSNTILSIVGFFKSEYGVGANRYDVYNIDILTGKQLSNQELLDIAGKTKEDIMPVAKDAYIREFIYQNDLQDSIKNTFGFMIPIDELEENLVKKGIICTKEYYDAHTNSSIPYENAIGPRNEAFKNTMKRFESINDIEEMKMYLFDEDTIEVYTEVSGFAGAV